MSLASHDPERANNEYARTQTYRNDPLRIGLIVVKGQRVPTGAVQRRVASAPNKSPNQIPEKDGEECCGQEELR